MLCSGSSLSAIPSAPGSGKGYSLPSRSVFLVGLPRGFGAQLSGQLTRLGYLLEKAIAISQNRIVVEGEFFCSRMSPPPPQIPVGRAWGPTVWEIYTTRTPLSTFKMKTFLIMMKIGNQFAIKQCPIVGPGQRILGTPYTNVSLRRFPGHPGQHFPAFSLRPLAVRPQDSDTRQRETENGGLRTMA